MPVPPAKHPLKPASTDHPRQSQVPYLAHRSQSLLEEISIQLLKASTGEGLRQINTFCQGLNLNADLPQHKADAMSQLTCKLLLLLIPAHAYCCCC